MTTAFVVFPEGDVWYIMQICPDALHSASGACPVSLYCDCQHSDDGPMWQFRGYFVQEHEARRRCAALQAQFDKDCARHAGVIARRREREGRGGPAALPDNLDANELPF